MKIIRLLALAVLCLVPPSLFAQTQTAVSATITDPSGIPYANGTYSIQLIPSGTNPSVGGAAIQGAFNGALNANGSFSASLWPNGSITPASTQWQFTICSNPGGIAPPMGTGTQCTPPTPITISGTAQVLSTTLSNVAPKLTNFASLGGTVTTASCGNLIPLFNCAVATPTSTPAFSFTQQNASANTVYAGPSSGAAANPTFRVLTAADLPVTGATGLQHITVDKFCPASSATCFTVADDGHIVSDATWSAGANVQVTIGASDPHFQCPGGVYPCNSSTPGCNASQTNLPNTSCDVFKVAFGTANCRAANPGQCDGSIPAGTISSIQSPTQLTLTSTASTASTTGTGNRQFAWFTLDDAPLAAAADAAFTSTTQTQVDLPCGYMGYSTSNFDPHRVTRVNSVDVHFNGYHCATFIVPPNFTCTATSGSGCLLSANGGAGQLPGTIQMWADSSESMTFLGLGQDSPTTISTQFPSTTSSLIYASSYVKLQDIWVVGLFWNASKTIYGSYCAQCSMIDNGVAWSAGSRGLYVSGAIQGAATILSGFYGNSVSHSCDVDGSNVVYLSGTQCNFPLNNNSTEAGAGLDTLSTFTGQLWTNGVNLQGSPYLNGGTVHLSGFYSNPQGGSSGIFVQNANVKLYIHEWHNAPNGGRWLTLSAGFVHLGCGASPWTAGYTGANAAVITGGTFQMDACSVGGDNLAAQVAAIGAKTLFTVGAGTALFRVHLSVECTTTSAAATVTPSVIYTDTSGTVQTVTGTNATCTALGAASNTSQDVTFRAKNATNIQYQTTIANTPTYDVSVAVEQLSLN